jgi:preprotein translocase subunit YajC
MIGVIIAVLLVCSIFGFYFWKQQKNKRNKTAPAEVQEVEMNEAGDL